MLGSILHDYQVSNSSSSFPEFSPELSFFFPLLFRSYHARPLCYLLDELVRCFSWKRQIDDFLS